MTTTTELATGKELVCYCTKCKMDLAHMIMSMVGANPARVLCKTCKSEHNFKVKKGVKEPGSTPASRKAAREKTAAADKVVAVEVEWLRQMNASTRPLKSYATSGFFGVGDKIAHSSFGEGIVQKHIYPNKLEILFKADVKVLVHSGKPLN